MTEQNCICKSWVRLDGLSEIIDGREYPAPDHANGCPAQQRQLYKRVMYDGTSCIIEPNGVADMLNGADPSDYEITDIMLTPEQVARMPEFEGF